MKKQHNYSRAQMILFIIFMLILVSTNIEAQSPQWRLLTNSPGISGSGRFEDMYFINENTGWIISFGGQSYKTINGGANWTVQNSIINLSRSIGFFDQNTGILGTLSANVLYRSTNGGLSYAVIQNLPPPAPTGICGISIVNESIAYACGAYYGPGIILKTIDKGATWTNVFSDSSLARSLVDCYFWTPDSGIAVGGYNASTGFANGNAVVIKTTNGGASWQRVYKTSRTREWCWKISFISRDIGFVSIERESGFSYILKTTNNGNNWSEIPFREYDQEGIGFINESTGWIGGWTGPTYMTTNGGTNWQPAGWGTYLNRFRFISDTLAYAVGDRVYKYSVGTVGITNSTSEVPNNFTLHQNFPNPFNPSTLITFEVSRPGLYELSVFDALGSKVSELMNNELNPGSYNVMFEGSSMPSGVYFYRLSNGLNSFSRKMLMVK